VTNHEQEAPPTPNEPDGFQIQVRQGRQYSETQIAVAFGRDAVSKLQEEIRHSLEPWKVVGQFLGACQYAVTFLPVPLPGVLAPPPGGPGPRIVS